jgi:hypothetical protein
MQILVRRSRSFFVILMTISGVTAFLFSCKPNKTVVVSSNPARVVDEHTDSTTYLDITKQAGITWKHSNGADGRKWFPEENGSGCAFFDYDNDGWEDILITDCRHWPGHRVEPESTMVLYHNNHDGTFTDVTKEVGLAIPMFSMGVAVGDYDNDGWEDLYITNVGENYLFHNDHGKFVDVTKKAHVAGGGGWEWSSSAMWVDYDNDGYLDLFCGCYAPWTPDKDVFCTVDGKTKAYCTPEFYGSSYNHMYHNNHDGTFTDVTKQVGMKDQAGRALGCIMFDYDNDGWTDIMISNDLAANKLYHNEHGVFKEIGVKAGIAYDENGRARAGMGMDYGDLDRDGKPTVIIANFAGEMDWVYKYIGNGVFVDRAPTDGIGEGTLPYLKFGTLITDYDYDGWPDMFCVDGHVQPEIEETQHTTTYRQPSLLFRNMQNGKFEEVGHTYMHGPFDVPIVGRGCAYGDINNDGNIDFLGVYTNGHPLLMECQRKNSNHYLRIKLQGVKSNREGIGAKVIAKVGNMTMNEMMKSGSAFQSSSEHIVSLGLGQSKQVDELVIKWNCGTVDTLHNVQGDRMVLIKEGSNAAEDVHWQK